MLLTQLEAVNLIRASIGDAPVQVLSGNTDPDVVAALNRLTNSTLELQSMSWWFNSDYNLTISPDTSGHIIVPANATEVRPRDPHTHLVQRGNKMYDPCTSSFVFTAPVKFDLLVALPFDDIPYIAANYVQYVAARKHQAGYDGDPARVTDLREDADDALAQLNKAELRNRRVNMLSSAGAQRLFSGINPQSRTSRDPTFPGG